MEKFKAFLNPFSLFSPLIFLILFLNPAGAELYKYTDQKGIVHFTDRYESIPKEYRHQIKTIKEEPRPQPPAATPETKEIKKEGEAAKEELARKDKEPEKKEGETIKRQAEEAEEKKQKALEAKEKQIEDLQKQIEDKRKQQRSLRTNWMVYDRYTIQRLNQEIQGLEKQIKTIQDEIEEGK